MGAGEALQTYSILTIGDQVLSQPKFLWVAGIIIVAFALIPGFPSIQFVLHRFSLRPKEEKEEITTAMAPAGQKLPRKKQQIRADFLSRYPCSLMFHLHCNNPSNLIHLMKN
ncbi:MAG: flagellar biosynthesis component FlhA [Desulforhopalus sp.]|jgi:flagellar biosynthesis component FlhA